MVNNDLFQNRTTTMLTFLNLLSIKMKGGPRTQSLFTVIFILLKQNATPYGKLFHNYVIHVSFTVML